MSLAQRVAALCAAAVLGAAALTVAAAPAHAASTEQATSVLLLTATPHATGVPRATVLRCEPAGGTHPRAASACQDVAAVDGNLAALSVNPGFCTLEYAPVTVRALGLWRDRPVSYTETFGNQCELLRETGSLFAF
ncbi:SSI family serine proteinase inhibitor [Micromonospora sp. WMMA1363]|uniref:SSI family serine proteinase inhibitor n=1 Tax=Micromonospora sp. WMMA1363 TaxID=3053985 RepID=UPI00259CBEE2|nr:SSI family serine proteinase inhibitor [Micromonospora sp. WMMA1363]MDM4719076.1 SSI family serine proteinase inhibitor [Micromonospora sp. WMMA1363]